MNATLLPLFAFSLSAATFAPGVISTGAHEGPFAFADGGETIYFTRLAAGMSTPGFFVSHLREGLWSPAEKASFPEGASAAPFSLSPDGTRLFFTHTADAGGRERLWVAEREGQRFTNARSLGGVFEKWDGDQISPSATSDGTLYFVSNRPGGSGGWDIYRSAMKDGQYAEPELLGRGRYRRISTIHHETSVTAAPDGSFLIFSSAADPNGFGGADLYLAQLPVSQRTGAWASNLGPLVNTAADEVDPRLSADGKRLYFSRAGDIHVIDLEAARRAPAESAAWKPRAEMPLARAWPQLAAADGRIYVYGGLDLRQRNRWAHQLDVYDPASDSWTALGPGPEGWTQASLVALDNRLFLFRRGGPGVAEYSAGTKSWAIRPASGDFAIAEASPYRARTLVLGRKAYTMFVAGNSREYSYLAEYDFDTGAWAPRRSMPSPALGWAPFAGRIYAFAGRSHTSAYDPARDDWTGAAPGDMPRCESAVAVVGEEIWLVGGHGTRGDELGDLSPTVVCFNPRRNTWRPGPPLPWQRYASGAVTVNGRLFVIGGIRTGHEFAPDQSVLEYVAGK